MAGRGSVSRTAAEITAPSITAEESARRAEAPKKSTQQNDRERWILFMRLSGLPNSVVGGSIRRAGCGIGCWICWRIERVKVFVYFGASNRNHLIEGFAFKPFGADDVEGDGFSETLQRPRLSGRI